MKHVSFIIYHPIGMVLSNMYACSLLYASSTKPFFFFTVSDSKKLRNGFLEIVQSLCEARANVEQVDEDGTSTVEIAQRSGHAVIETLLTCVKKKDVFKCLLALRLCCVNLIDDVNSDRFEPKGIVYHCLRKGILRRNIEFWWVKI